MSDIELAPLLDNWRAYWLGWGREYADSAIFRSGVAIPRFNGVVHQGRRSPDALLADVRERLAGIGWQWRIGPDDPPGTADWLLGEGGRPDGRNPIMAVRLAQVVVGRGVETLNVSPAPDLVAWVGAGMNGYGMSRAHLESMVAAEAAMPGAVTRFEGRIGDRVIATSALFESAGVAGVYAVSVTPAFRRRGIGAAMTTAALNLASARGFTVATLQANDDSRSGYARMGFEVAAEYEVFTL